MRSLLPDDHVGRAGVISQRVHVMTMTVHAVSGRIVPVPGSSVMRIPVAGIGAVTRVLSFVIPAAVRRGMVSRMTPVVTAGTSKIVAAHVVVRAEAAMRGSGI